MAGEGGTDTLEHSLNQFVSSYQQFHTGIVEYTEGVDQLTTIYDDVHRGIKDLHNGTTEIKDGSEELQEGTSTLYQETRGLPKQMEAGIDEFLNSYKGEDFVATSFMSEKNKKIETVQFILQTEGINHPEIEVKEEEKKEKARILESFEATFYWQ
ncbi:MAG TPA: hypothetical protein VK037_00645 [Pseudogracilibacillus sp.]|nr:hypothetical protein [Pseudogracilibacillus sp.]